MSQNATDNRSTKFGIDCGGGLDWKGGTWAPGGEYIKRLQVKNVSRELQRIKYKLPKTKFFSMGFPELIKLSPGMHIMVPENYAFDIMPIKLEEYNDFVEFSSRKGTFRVPIYAGIAKLAVQVPQELDFGHCPVNELVERIFTIENIGELSAPFRLDFSPPFHMSPASGVLDVGEKKQIVAKFSPTVAEVWLSTSVAVISESQSKVIQVRGMGKYPHITPSINTLDFGSQLIGSTGSCVEKEFTLTNHTIVHASFEIERLDTDGKSLFAFAPVSGIVPPRDCMKIKVRYTPTTNSVYSNDYFHIITPGGNKVTLICRGKATGPSMILYKKVISGTQSPGRMNCINFGDVKVGQTVTRVLLLRNSSKLPSNYQFMANANGVFSFSQPQGIIQAELEAPIVLSFQPTEPGNFYRRVFCMFLNQTPQYVDILGTAFTDKQRPMPLKQRHIDAFTLRKRAGFAKLSPDEIESILALPNSTDAKKLLGLDDKSLEWDAKMSVESRSGDKVKESELAIFHNFFTKYNDKSNEIVLTETEIEFGAVSRTKLCEKKTVHITNKTNAKVAVMWKLPGEAADLHNNSIHAFNVFPRTLDINPGKTVSFKVSFRPSLDNQYYCEELEAYVYVKKNRNFRLVNDESFTPPWCVTVSARGHTFIHSGEFLPKVNLNLRKNTLLLPPCHLGDASYNTFLLNNVSDTPALFSFTHDPSGVFQVKPQCGLIQGNQSQIIAIEFRPPKIGNFAFNLVCNLNNSIGDTINISVVGASFLPQIAIDNGSMLYFKPTCTGIQSNRILKIRNTTRIPILMSFKLPQRIQQIFQVAMRQIILRGNEEFSTEWAFSPEKQKQYHAAINCSVTSIQLQGPSSYETCTVRRDSHENIHLETPLKLVGLGTSGALEFDPPTLNFGTTLLDDITQRRLTLINTSDCTINYRLYLFCKLKGEENDWIEIINPTKKNLESLMDSTSSSMTLSEYSGAIQARSKYNIKVTFTPHDCESREYKITWSLRKQEKKYTSVVLQTAADKSSSNVPSDAACLEVEADNEDDDYSKSHCLVNGRGGYPTLAFDDIRNENLKPSLAWEMFQLSQINQCLSEPLDDEDIEYNKRTGLNQQPELLKTFEFNFLPALKGSSTAVTWVRVRNTSHLNVDFSLKLPNDIEVEVEPWADAGEPTEAELRQNQILDSRLFKVTPRNGSLKPNESTVLKFSYVYSMLKYNGRHNVHAVLSLARGKQIRINLAGVTLPPNTPHLDCLPMVSLKDVFVGNPVAQAQLSTLRNPGTIPLKYSIDMSPFEDLKQNNFGFNVLCPQYDSGVIPPHGEVYVKWKFHPIESKHYHVETSISYERTLKGGKITKESQQLVVNGTGVNETLITSKGQTDVNSWLTTPTTQLLQNPSQVAILSIEKVSFGVIPLNASATRIIVLRNLLEDEELSFHWDTEHPLVSSGAVKFQPKSGRLSEGGVCVVKVMYQADEESCFLNIDIPIIFTPILDEYTQGILKSQQDSKNDSRLSPNGRRASLGFTASSGSNVFNTEKDMYSVPPTRESVVSRSTKARELSKSTYMAGNDAKADCLLRVEALQQERAARKEHLNSDKTDMMSPTNSWLSTDENQTLNGFSSSLPSTLFLNLTLEVTDTETFIQYYGGVKALNGFFNRRHSEFTGKKNQEKCEINVKTQEILKSTEEIKDATVDFVSNLLQEIVHDSCISTLYPSLEPLSVPYFHQIKQQSIKYVNHPATIDKSMVITDTELVESDIVISKPLQDPECHELVSRLLENTVFNLMSEAVHSEFKLNKVPKHTVVFVDDTSDTYGSH